MHVSVFLANPVVQISNKQIEIDFQMNANEQYCIVKSARIVGVCERTEPATSTVEHDIDCAFNKEN